MTFAMDPNNLQALSSQFGLINSLRTGNVVLDMMVCMLIPVIFKLVADSWQQLWPMLKEFFDSFGSQKGYVIKSLDYEFRTNAWGSVLRAGKEERNNILQKAITLYIGTLKGIKLESSRVSFMAAKEKGQRDNDTWEVQYGSTAEQLEQYAINTLPPNDIWVDLRPNLSFRQSNKEDENENKEAKVNKNMIKYEFRSQGPDAEKTIDEFIQDAFQWYLQKIKSTQDHSRYLYMLIKSPPSTSSSDENNESSPSRVYKRYKLSDEKSFECLFFREKEMLTKLLAHFKNKTGKYAIKGFPHKLGLLLHGPPGTGKTSLIKALAQHTGRNVVSIPLARIETNQELMDIVFDQSFAVQGEDMPIKLSFKDIIFVMEDVDAASPIVQTRSSGTTPKEKVVIEEDKKEDTAVGTGDSDGVVEVTTGGDGEDKALMMAMINSLTDSGTKSTAVDYKSKYMSRYDKLDLAGLLNVLDGVVDCPNRILVMTTNHPEKLDPALIRPGRIDKIIYLGYIQAPEAKEMVQHYFQIPMTAAQYHRLEMALTAPHGAGEFTPAEVEQLCAEYDDIDDFLSALEERVLENQPQTISIDLTKCKSTTSGGLPTPTILRRGLSTTAKTHDHAHHHMDPVPESPEVSAVVG